MKKRIMLVGTVLMTVLCSLSVKADKVYYVDPDGNNPENMTVDAVYTTLAAAVSQLTETEPTTIYLKPDCTFSEGDILFEQRADVKIIGKNTTFTGIKNKRILITRAARLELKGITFRNVDYSYGSGGALFFRGVTDASSDLVVDSCVFVDNSMPGNSEYINGGVAIATDANDMNVSIKNCVFKNNSVDKYGDAMRGAAVLHKGKNGTFEVSNSTFEGNMTVESQSGAMSVGFYDDCENVKARFVNNTFYNNTTRTVPTGSVPNILITGSSNEVQVVNNTFYFDRREEDPGEDSGDQERMKAVYKRTAAVNVNQDNTLYFVNNAVVGMRSAVISPVASGRTIVCYNNYNVVVEPHGNVSELVDGQNGNVLLTARESNAGDPFMADIEALDNLMQGTGIDKELETDNFVPYLPISGTSPLVNAGINEYLVSEVNIVPAVDVLGNSRNDGGADIGAYEYVEQTQGPGTGLLDNDLRTELSVSVQESQLVVENHSEEQFELSLIQVDGRLVATMPLQHSVAISRNALPQGVLLLVATNGVTRITEKVIL